MSQTNSTPTALRPIPNALAVARVLMVFIVRHFDLVEVLEDEGLPLRKRWRLVEHLADDQATLTLVPRSVEQIKL
jgi:hypothetical protein